MNLNLIFDFNTDITEVDIPKTLNNPFTLDIPEIADIAAKEFQEHITSASKKWDYDFLTRHGKMFGILVVQRKDKRYSFLGTNSGALPGNSDHNRLIPSVFDNTTDDYFFDRGMTAVTELCNRINNSTSPSEIINLTEERKVKSYSIQQQLFQNYHFSNILGISKNILEIFELSSHGIPPAATGECAAPKLLQFAFDHDLKPIAIAEFWWGNPTKNQEKKHKHYYPACKNKCRPLLEYMLNDTELYE